LSVIGEEDARCIAHLPLTAKAIEVAKGGQVVGKNSNKEDNLWRQYQK